MLRNTRSITGNTDAINEIIRLLKQMNVYLKILANA